MSRNPFFPLPLQMGVLDHFCHPDERHVLAHPVFYSGQALAANCYVAIRVDRGLWMESDFAEPPVGMLQRVLSLPWMDVRELDPDGWKSMHEVGRHLWRHGRIEPWLKGKAAPSPVWRVNESFLCRLSHLQLVAQLPRAEVWCGARNAADPLRFRFSGGIGLVAVDGRLTESSFSIFDAARHEDGSRKVKHGPCLLPPKRAKWPDFEPIDGK